MSKTALFLTLEKQLKFYITTMKNAADVIRDEGVSNYPIFAAHQGELSIGLPLVEIEKHGGIWNINASTLEEFVAKNIIFNEKIDDFRTNFKDADHHVCVFVLSELGATFNFFPVK